MGETTDQTRAEIVQLRTEMAEKVVDLRRRAERPMRIARALAIGAGVAVVVGTTVLIVARARRQPETPLAKVKKIPEKAADQVRDKLREEIRKELEKELKTGEPLSRRLLQTATRAAATAAVAAAMRSMQERRKSGEPDAAGA